MTRAKGVVAVLLLGSCLPGRFDDLQNTAWVQLAERDDSQASGDWATEIVALPPDSGKMGVRYVMAMGAVPGLAQVSFDEKGQKTEQIGFNALAGGQGQIQPIDDKAAPDSLAAYGTGGQFVAGMPDKPLVARFDAGLKNGTTLVASNSGFSKAGSAVATGNLGLGSANGDVVAQGQLALVIIPNGDSTKIKSCGAFIPDPPQGTFLGYETVQLAPVKKNGHDQIVMAGRDASNQPWIYIFESAEVTDGQACPTGGGFKVTGTAPNAIAVADVDGDGTLDLVTGTFAASGTGTVNFYKGPLTGGAAPTAQTIPAMGSDSASNLRGNRIKIADLDGDGKAEIVVADVGASLQNVNLSGEVMVYKNKPDACGDASAARGPWCLATILSDSSPENKDQFGRALAVAPFPTPSSATNILAVVEKNKTWVYFRIFTTATDPRAK